MFCWSYVFCLVVTCMIIVVCLFLDGRAMFCWESCDCHVMLRTCRSLKKKVRRKKPRDQRIYKLA